MGKLLLTCSVVILFILLQTDEIVSISKKGSSRPSGSSSNRKPGRPSRPSHHPSRPSHHPSKPAEKPRKPAYNPPIQNRPAQQAPPKKPENPSRNHPSHANHPENPPPYNPAHPPHNPANRQHPGHPPPYPVNPQNPAHPPSNPVNPGNPPPYNPAYLPPHPVNPQNPGHPPPYPVNPQNPAHPPPYPANPPNPGYFPHQPNYPQNPNWGHYDPKPWKPKSPKTKLKHTAGAAIAGAAAGALGGYFLGRAMSKLHFHFNNQNEERWWYENRHRYSDRVYYPQYIQPVPQDIFVRDCVNITVKEYIEPSGNETEDEIEARVVKHVVREMCIEQYRTFSSSSEGGSFSPYGGNPVDSKPSDAETKHVMGEVLIDVPVEDSNSYILGSPIANMYFHFNDSEEEHWWNENRLRFATHVYHPNYSQPVSKDAFLSECVNVTVGEYVKPTGNQTQDELEARVVTQVANAKCMEMYHRISGLTAGSSYYEHKLKTATTLAELEIKHGAGIALAGSPGGAGRDNTFNNAVSDLHFSFENALLPIHPFVISFLTLITPFLIF